MQTSNKREAKTQSTGATARPLHLFGAALLAAAALPACSVPTADAGVETSPKDGENRQALTIEQAAKCNTAPPRNSTRKRASVAHVFRNSDQSNHIMVLASTGTAFGNKQDFANHDGGFSASDRWSSGDFDGDGDQDLMAAWNNGGTTALAFRQAIGNSFVTSQVTLPSVPWSAETIWVPGNFNGTGAAELAAISHDGSSTSIDVFFFSFPAGIASQQRFVNRGTPWLSTTKWSVGDFDYNGNSNPNDDRDDLVSVANINGLTATVWLSSGTAFSGAAWSNSGGWSDESTYVAGDFTGDGRADLAGIWDNANHASIAVYPSNGSSFSTPSQWITDYWPHSSAHHWVAGYFNDDDKMDLARMHWDFDYYTTISTYLSNSAGTAFILGFGGNTTYWSSGQDTLCSGVFNAQQ